MVGITTGINTGIDIAGIVTAMVNSEKAPKENQLTRLEKATTTKFSALGTLKSGLNDLQTTLKELKDPALYEKRSATSSNTAAATATASKGATAGSYKITVDRLATASKVATSAVDTNFTASGPGNLTVRLGADDKDAISVAIAAGDTLSAIHEKLNSALKDKGITANIINNPGDGTSRLVLSAKESGSGKDIYVSSDAAALSSLAIGSIDDTDPANPVGTLGAVSGSGAGYLTQAQDALFTIDGLSLTSANNSVSGVIPDVTVKLSATTEADKPLTLTVDDDRAAVKSSVKKFVDAYNKLISTTKTLTNVTQVGDDEAPVVGGLVGDSSVRNLLSGIRNELVNPGTSSESVKFLSDLGITTTKEGKLEINDSKLTAALESNYDAVGAFFTGDNGLMNRLNSRIDGYVKTGGMLQQRMDGLQSTLTSIDGQREALDRRVDQMQKRLFAQFTAMDSLVGQLQQTSSSLLNSLANLPGVAKQS